MKADQPLTRMQNEGEYTYVMRLKRLFETRGWWRGFIFGMWAGAALTLIVLTAIN